MTKRKQVIIKTSQLPDWVLQEAVIQGFKQIEENNQHVDWKPGDTHITINGRFTVQELKAIIAYVKGAK